MLAIASPFGGLRRALRARRSPSGPLARPSPALRGLGRRPAGRAGLLPCRLAASGVPAFGGALRARWRLPPRSPSAFPPCAPLRRARRPGGLLRGFASRARLAPAGSSPPRLLAASRLAGCLGAGVWGLVAGAQYLSKKFGRVSNWFDSIARWGRCKYPNSGCAPRNDFRGKIGLRGAQLAAQKGSQFFILINKKLLDESQVEKKVLKKGIKTTKALAIVCRMVYNNVVKGYYTVYYTSDWKGFCYGLQL